MLNREREREKNYHIKSIVYLFFEHSNRFIGIYMCVLSFAYPHSSCHSFQESFSFSLKMTNETNKKKRRKKKLIHKHLIRVVCSYSNSLYIFFCVFCSLGLRRKQMPGRSIHISIELYGSFFGIETSRTESTSNFGRCMFATCIKIT